MDGLIIVDKPTGPTSHDVVARLRRVLGGVKTGHCGTLDPLASGVLLVAVGRAARLFPFLSGHDKAYSGSIRFGFATDTYDAAGQPTSGETACLPAEAAIRKAMRRFEGLIRQVPPAYSALKQDGKPLYRLARENREVRIAPRDVTVHRFALVSWIPPFAEFEVECSAGTYVRSMAHDLGRELGCGAHLAALRRTASGPYTLASAHTIEDIEASVYSAAPARFFVPMERLLPELPAFTLRPEGVERVRHGNRILPGHIARTPDGAETAACGADAVLRLFSEGGKLLALARLSPDGEGLSPFLVLTD